VPGTESVPRFIMALSEDITKRKRTEETLRRSETYLAEGQSCALPAPLSLLQIENFPQHSEEFAKASAKFSG
jgi:hypothetical protein